MSKYARHEIVMNGVNTEGKLQRTLVLDASHNPRHVFKMNRHYAERFERTSQFAYTGDYVLETTAFHDEEKITQVDFKVYRLSGPCSGAGGRLQLFRVETPEHIETFRKQLLEGTLKEFLEFMLLDENFGPSNADPLTVNAVLPTFLGWNGEVGITEEKQSAYIIDLLGGAPMEYIEDVAFMAMYSKRQYIMPFESHGIPKTFNFHNTIAGSAGFTPRNDAEINWVIFYLNGGVEIVKTLEQAEAINHKNVSTALKMYLEPFTTETGKNFGLVVEVYSSSSVTQATLAEEEEVATVC